MRAGERPPTVGRKVGFANKAMWRVLEARDAGLGAHVRRHGASTRATDGAAAAGAHVLAEDRTRDRLQDEDSRSGLTDASRPRCSRPSSGSRSGSRSSTACFRTGNSSPPISWRRLACMRRWSSASRVGRGDDIATLVDQLPRFKVRLLEGRPARRRGLRQELAPQPGAVPGRAGVGDCAPADGEAAGRRRSRQLRHADRIATDRRRRNVDGRRRRPGPAGSDGANVTYIRDQGSGIRDQASGTRRTCGNPQHLRHPSRSTPRSIHHQRLPA